MTTTWAVPFAEPRTWSPDLGSTEIHIWAVELTVGTDSLAPLLSPDELARARRLRFAKDRQRYVAARGSLRQILARYTGTSPTDLRFRYGERGKPHLEGDDPVEFNLTHSGDIALVAVTRIGAVGIDVEKTRPLEDLLDLARGNFAPSEYATLLSLPETERLASFFRFWTQKEAYVKAVGDGLAQPLADFSVSGSPAETARFLSLGGSQAASRRWYLVGLRPSAGYEGALAVKGRPRKLETWIWKHP